MDNFIKERREYFKKLEEHKHVVVRLASSKEDAEMLRILLYPKNEEELIKANAYLDFSIDLEKLCVNAMFGKVKKPEEKDNAFIEFLILAFKIADSGNGGKELSEEMSKKAASRGYSDVEYMAELIFNAVLLPFWGDYDLFIKPVAESCGINLSDEFEAMKFKTMIEQLSKNMPQPKSEDETKKFTDFVNHFHEKCIDNMIVEEDKLEDKVVKRILEMFHRKD